MGRHTLCALYPQPYEVPLQFFTLPASGDSACLPSRRAFLREIPNFILELRLESSSVSASQLCPEALFYLVLHYSLVPLDSFCKSSVLGVILEWCVWSVHLLKHLQLSL